MNKKLMNIAELKNKPFRQEFNQWFSRFMCYPTTRSCAERDIFRNLKEQMYVEFLKCEKGYQLYWGEPFGLTETCEKD